MTKLTLVGVLLLLTGATVMAEETTSVQNGTNSATVTQSGPSGDTQKSVTRAPGYSRIEQNSGGNAAVITQDSNPGATSQDDDDDVMPAPKPRAETAPRTDADVYGIVRERASPQGRANLDSLMGMLGLSAKRDEAENAVRLAATGRGKRPEVPIGCVPCCEPVPPFAQRHSGLASSSAQAAASALGKSPPTTPVRKRPAPS